MKYLTSMVADVTLRNMDVLVTKDNMADAMTVWSLHTKAKAKAGTEPNMANPPAIGSALHHETFNHSWLMVKDHEGNLVKKVDDTVLEHGRNMSSLIDTAMLPVYERSIIIGSIFEGPEGTVAKIMSTDTFWHIVLYMTNLEYRAAWHRLLNIKWVGVHKRYVLQRAAPKTVCGSKCPRLLFAETDLVNEHIYKPYGLDCSVPGMMTPSESVNRINQFGRKIETLPVAPRVKVMAGGGKGVIYAHPDYLAKTKLLGKKLIGSLKGHVFEAKGLMLEAMKDYDLLVFTDDIKIAHLAANLDEMAKNILVASGLSAEERNTGNKPVMNRSLWATIPGGAEALLKYPPFVKLMEKIAHYMRYAPEAMRTGDVNEYIMLDSWIDKDSGVRKYGRGAKLVMNGQPLMHPKVWKHFERRLRRMFTDAFRIRVGGSVNVAGPLIGLDIAADAMYAWETNTVKRGVLIAQEKIRREKETDIERDTRCFIAAGATLELVYVPPEMRMYWVYVKVVNGITYVDPSFMYDLLQKDFDGDQIIIMKLFSDNAKRPRLGDILGFKRDYFKSWMNPTDRAQLMAAATYPAKKKSGPDPRTYEQCMISGAESYNLISLWTNAKNQLIAALRHEGKLSFSELDDLDLTIMAEDVQPNINSTKHSDTALLSPNVMGDDGEMHIDPVWLAKRGRGITEAQFIDASVRFSAVKTGNFALLNKLTSVESKEFHYVMSSMLGNWPLPTEIDQEEAGEMVLKKLGTSSAAIDAAREKHKASIKNKTVITTVGGSVIGMKRIATPKNKVQQVAMMDYIRRANSVKGYSPEAVKARFKLLCPMLKDPVVGLMFAAYLAVRKDYGLLNHVENYLHVDVLSKAEGRS